MTPMPKAEPRTPHSHFTTEALRQPVCPVCGVVLPVVQSK